MIISIAIADSNSEYVRRLTEVLQQNNELNISVFTSTETLSSALEREKYDILLFDPDLSNDRLPVSKVKLAVCLYSDDAENSSLYADLEKVLKYQRISSICREILRLYAEKAGYDAELNNSWRTELIGVYSPIGGSGKTLVSLAVAGRLAEYGKSVLFLSMEQLNSSSCVFPYTEEGNTVLVEAANGDAVFQLTLRGVAKAGFNGIFYVEGFRRIVDYCDVDEAEIGTVLDCIRKCGVYEKVIIDMGSIMDGMNRTVFEKSDHVIVVNKPGEISSIKMNLFASQGITTENRSKMVKINNFAENNSRYNDDLEIPTIGLIHNYGNLAEKSIIQAIHNNKEIDISRFLA